MATTHAFDRARQSIFLFVVAVASSGCSNCSKQQPSTTDGGTTTMAASASASSQPDRRPTTTSPIIAMGNMNGDIADRIKRADGRVSERLHLIELLLARAQFLARTSDLEKADEIGADTAKQAPTLGDARFCHALTLSAFHKFDDALKELDEAAKGKDRASEEKLRGTRVSIFLAQGRYDDAAALFPPNIEKRDFEIIATAGYLAGREQKFDEAERLFILARARYNNVAPFPVAWIDFQRATILDAAGKDGRPWYAEAVDILPQYAHAAVHLALAEPPPAAITRLEELRTSSEDDGDVLAGLAEAHKRAAQADEQKKYVDLASKRYEEVLKKHPEAYADHAARFYLGIGNDPDRALKLARDNAKLRSTEEALDLWMGAAVGAKKPDDICKSSIAMTKLKYLSENGRRVATAAVEKCPDAGK